MDVSKLSEQEIEQIVSVWFGVDTKYLEWDQYSVRVNVTEMGRNGIDASWQPFEKGLGFQKALRLGLVHKAP